MLDRVSAGRAAVKRVASWRRTMTTTQGAEAEGLGPVPAGGARLPVGSATPGAVRGELAGSGLGLRWARGCVWRWSRRGGWCSRASTRWRRRRSLCASALRRRSRPRESEVPEVAARRRRLTVSSLSDPRERPPEAAGRWHATPVKPYIRMRGQWLRRLGFEVGTRIEVEVGAGAAGASDGAGRGGLRDLRGAGPAGEG